MARGPYHLVASFSRERVHVPLDGTAALVLATGHATLEPGAVVLAPLCGAVLRIG